MRHRVTSLLASQEQALFDRSEIYDTTLKDFHELAACHPSARAFEVVGTEIYATFGRLYSHRFIVVTLRSFDGRYCFLRLERRRSPNSPLPRFLLSGGTGPVHDLVSIIITAYSMSCSSMAGADTLFSAQERSDF